MVNIPNNILLWLYLTSKHLPFFQSLVLLVLDGNEIKLVKPKEVREASIRNVLIFQETYLDPQGFHINIYILC